MDSLSNFDKKKLFSLFEKMDKEKIANRKSKTLNSDVLLIDGLNTFIRAFSVAPTMSDNGNHVGGISGFLKSVAYGIRMLNPTRCIIVFDGNGGSKKRREIYPEYKANRKTRIRLNRMYTDISTPDLEQDSMKDQLLKLVSYLDCLPLTIMSIDHIEADDTIGYLASEIFTEEESTVTIMSADKDFLQLVNDRVKVWSPTKKKMYGPPEIQGEFGISCKNFIYFRMMDGDKGDNINGVRGAGLKTILKAFPMLKDESKVTLEEIIKYAESNINGLKIYESVVNNKELLDRNQKLMRLDEVDISGSTKTKIMDIVDKPIPELNKMKFTQLLSQDKMFSAIDNHLVWMGESFAILDTFGKNNKNK